MSIFEIQTPQESIGFQFWKLHQQWQKHVATTLSEFDITHTQFVMMASIAWFEEQKKQPSQAQVAKLMNLDKMAFSKAVRQLENNHFVERKHSKVDKRARSLSLTTKASDILPQAMKAIEHVDRNIFGALGERQQTFNKILLLLNKQLST